MLRTSVRQFLEKSLGIHIYRAPPRGTDIFYDIATALPDLKVKTIFDIGANVGQSARQFLGVFPEAHVHSFEPVPATFAKLHAATAAEPRVSAHNIALGSSTRDDHMAVSETSRRSRITADGEAPGDWPVVTVQVDSLDSFCAREGIDHINLLKSDTEGHDLEVLKGAELMLSRAAIDLVQVEVGLNRRNSWHVPFETITQVMRGHGYDLFAIAEQQARRGEGTPYLYRVDAVYLSPRWEKHKS